MVGLSAFLSEFQKAGKTHCASSMRRLPGVRNRAASAAAASRAGAWPFPLSCCRFDRRIAGRSGPGQLPCKAGVGRQAIGYLVHRERCAANRDRHKERLFVSPWADQAVGGIDQDDAAAAAIGRPVPREDCRPVPALFFRGSITPPPALHFLALTRSTAHGSRSS